MGREVPDPEGDAKTMFSFNRRLNDPQWKYQAPSKPKENSN